MGANLLIVVASLAFQSPQPDSPPDTSTAHGIAFERLSDLLQYNRVQGLSLGAGYRIRIPGTISTNAYGTLRYGLSDDRVTGRFAVLGSAAGGRLALSGYHDIADLDPFSPGRSGRVGLLALAQGFARNCEEDTTNTRAVVSDCVGASIPRFAPDANALFRCSLSTVAANPNGPPSRFFGKWKEPNG